MRSIYKKWQEIREKGENFLKELYYEKDFDFGDLFEKRNSKEYILALEKFHLLFNANEEMKTYLWNVISKSIEFKNLDFLNRQDFSEEEFAFIKSVSDTFRDANLKYNTTDLENINVNSLFETKNLLIKPYNSQLDQQYSNYFLNNPDEYKYLVNHYDYDLEDIEEWIKYRKKSLSFALILKDTNKYIGTLDMEETIYQGRYSFEIYIFPEYRQKGYATEAAMKVQELIKSNTIVIYEETIRKGLYKLISPEIHCLSTRILESDEPANKLAARTNFICCGEMKECVKKDDKYLSLLLWDNVL